MEALESFSSPAWADKLDMEFDDMELHWHPKKLPLPQPRLGLSSCGRDDGAGGGAAGVPAGPLARAAAFSRRSIGLWKLRSFLVQQTPLDTRRISSRSHVELAGQKLGLLRLQAAFC
mmetsp:Transcript_1516/g.3496  ORF Transcript_1516/g.3496 Transcript_1516/m.3496 type:complete len:117 (+) Transcript_1516:131-481(+)